MYLKRASYEIKYHMDYEAACSLIAWAGRKCYQSEPRGTDESFIRKLLNKTPPHESVIEHVSITVDFITDRGVGNEVVRHRLAAYSQESTRFCNYGKKGITFIIPPWIDKVHEGEVLRIRPPFIVYPDTETTERSAYHNEATIDWVQGLIQAEEQYNRMLGHGWKPEQARGHLPLFTKTDLVATYNLREWRHVFRMRTFEKAHPQMRELMCPLLEELKQSYPVFFENL